MTRARIAWLVGALALTGCKKKEQDPPPAPAPGDHVDGPGPGDGKGGGPGDGKGGRDRKGPGDSPTPVAPDPALIERGRYVATLGGCVGCHTPIDMATLAPDMSKMFGGGTPIQDQFGTWAGPNITPDKDTGIGGWSDAQIIAAVREGVRPDGGHIAPIMPWMHYAVMSDDDARALVAFLRSLPPVARKTPPNQLNMPPMPPVQVTRGDTPGDPVKHGAYLASIMHCAHCHTPIGPQGPDATKAFAGGMEFPMPQLGTGSVFAANITSDPATGIGAWSAADIAKAISTMVRPDGKPITGPMMFYAPLWSQLTPDDAAALAAFVKQLPPIANKVPASTFKPHAGPPPGGPPPGDGKAPAPPPAPGDGKAPPAPGK